jgi:putative peptidoglycan lipid II flippase
MSQMLKSSGAMGLATLMSRLLGLVREQVYAAFMGTSAVAGAFHMAFTVPNLFRRLLGEGALTAAFIPIFKAKEKTDGEVEMWRAANVVISGLLVSAALVVAGVLLALSAVLAWANLADSTRLMLQLLRLMFPYMLLVCLAAVLMGMLNARGFFFVPAFGAAMLNVVMIASVLLLAPRMGEDLETQIFGLAVGVLVAGLAQAGFQMPSLWGQGYRYRWVSPWRDPTVREVVRKMLPASVGVAAFQINVLVTQALAFGVHAPIVAAFNYSVRLMEFPQGLFGISLATYLLPTLSGHASEKDYDGFRGALREGLSYLLLLNLLASALLISLAEPVVRLLFQYGRFDPGSTFVVARALACLAPGLVAFSAVNIVARAFYALGDTITPMRISVFCLALNVVFAGMFLIGLDLGAAGLAVANSMTSTLNLGLLLFGLRRKLVRLDLGPLRESLAASLGAAALAGVVAWTAWKAWELACGRPAEPTLPLRLGAVLVPMFLATVVYGVVCHWAGVPGARAIRQALAGCLRRKQDR